MEDSNSFREMTEFMEATHDDLWEQLPGNGQVTLLVFREGNRLYVDHFGPKKGRIEASVKISNSSVESIRDILSNRPIPLPSQGDHINFFRVVDRGDGTLTPLSESIGGPSGYGIT